MDYSKLAYLKAEDLEARMQKIMPANRISKISVGKNLIDSNTYFNLTFIEGQGAVGIFVNLRFENAPINAQVSLAINGKLAASETVFNGSVSFMVSADLDNSARIGLFLDSKLLLIKGDVMIVGGAEISGGNPHFKLDTRNGKAGAIKIENGITFFELGDIENPVLDNGLLLGFGDDADVCGLKYNQEDVWLIAHKDKLNKVFVSVIKKIANKYQIIKTKFVIKEADSVALLLYQDEAVLGYTDKGVAYVGAINSQLGLENTVKIDLASRIDFIKKSSPPVAMLLSKEKNVLRISEAELKNKDFININIIDTVL